MILSEKIKKFFKPSYLFGLGLRFFANYARVGIFLFAIILVGFCINIWYGTIYRPQWSDEQKNVYTQSKGQGTAFNERAFEYDVAAVNARKEESQKDFGTLVDIFRLKTAVAPIVPLVTAPVAPNVPVKSNSSSGILSAPSVSEK